MRRAYALFPQALPDAERSRHDFWLHDRLHATGSRRWRTLADAREEVNRLRAEALDTLAEAAGDSDEMSASLARLADIDSWIGALIGRRHSEA